MRGFLSRLSLLLLALLSVFTVSVHEVDAAISATNDDFWSNDSGYPNSTAFPATSNRPVESVRLSILTDIAKRDARFSYLTKYGKLSYVLLLNLYSPDETIENATPKGYTLLISPRLIRYPDSTSRTVRIAASGNHSVYSDYAEYTGTDYTIKNGLFGLEHGGERTDYVFGHYYNLEGVYMGPVSLPADNLHDSVEFAFHLADGANYGDFALLYTNIPYYYGGGGSRYRYSEQYFIPEINSDALTALAVYDREYAFANPGLLVTPEDDSTDDSDAGIFEKIWAGIVGLPGAIVSGLAALLKAIVDAVLSIPGLIIEGIRLLFAGLFAGIQFIVDFFIGIVDFIVNLIVPDPEMIRMIFADLRNDFAIKFELLSELLLTVESLVQWIVENHTGAPPVVELGELFGGRAFIDFGFLEREMPAVFFSLQKVMQLQIGYAFVRSVIYRLLTLMAGYQLTDAQEAVEAPAKKTAPIGFGR